jgi:uncharacterized membrane protein (UPF0136 family)
MSDSRQPSYYRHLIKKLWLGTLGMNLLLLAVVAYQWPHLIVHLIWGILLGWFYLWSLSFNAENPKKGIQFVFSLIRIWIFAYVIVKLSNARVPELAIVMCGLLSYKVILMAEYVVQAMQAFRPQPSIKR